MDLDFSFLTTYWPMFLKGAGYTLVLAFFTVICGTILGIFICLMRISKIKIVKGIAAAYIEFLRGTPLLVQLYIIYFALPQFGISLPGMVSGIAALTLNSAAYVAEIFRAGIESIDKGQMEAARSLGMTHNMAMKLIIIPQAIRNILPALGNEFIVIIKESSIVSIVGITDLMFNADTVRGVTYKAFEPLIVAAVVYFIMTFTLSKLLGKFERRIKRA
ncbi:polar amino acid ABC transporter, inner membrane subunit [Paenibacillus larvae subsp. larvae]|uniref:Polar amino acid ABC transporter, inner membrane subunit n=1 Tax=Paenibacillus larvae subsp. larvae TaxID=147375 RepID=A0A2L1TZM0_9BACL|nr:amino acid ABC transporter permease [Paenibacillus larvae]AVF26114.1 polar amino acid ABC transporter, inner membrane subunit [Paenibacillus larvae subsp. larvae]AVF30892.1 polar amino acid ABC transporter, inner membrane subunit [Paenibacillus larvae subsp. larvae]MCY7518305.1 amino acid ABC transporter permease [Paenibacillus larvae]MCY9502685.1 amino acid ABC transporter permease [Paenibacillus larvae]MCY9678142.1 amino acid ABC transporter permease [Paenibacillus larvae]